MVHIHANGLVRVNLDDSGDAHANTTLPQLKQLIMELLQPGETVYSTAIHPTVHLCCAGNQRPETAERCFEEATEESCPEVCPKPITRTRTFQEACQRPLPQP